MESVVYQYGMNCSKGNEEKYLKINIRFKDDLQREEATGLLHMVHLHGVDQAIKFKYGNQWYIDDIIECCSKLPNDTIEDLDFSNIKICDFEQ